MPLPPPASSRVSLVIIDPLMSPGSGVRLSQVFGWNDPHLLAASFIADIREASYGLLDYRIAERILVEDFLPMDYHIAPSPLQGKGHLLGLLPLTVLKWN